MTKTKEGLLLHLSSLKRGLQINKVYDVTDLGDLICDIEEAMREVVSQIQAWIDKYRLDSSMVPIGSVKWVQLDGKIIELSKVLALLVSSSATSTDSSPPKKCGDCRHWMRGGIGAGRGGGFCMRWNIPKLASNELAPKGGCYMEKEGSGEKQ